MQTGYIFFHSGLLLSPHFERRQKIKSILPAYDGFPLLDTKNA